MMAGIIVGAAGHAAGSIGLEYFPFSRVGLALECGVRAKLVRAVPISEKLNVDAKMLLFYETPIALSLLMIL